MYQAGQQLANGLAILAERKRQTELTAQEERAQEQAETEMLRARADAAFARLKAQEHWSPQSLLTVKQDQDQYMRSVRWHGSRKGAVHIKGSNQYEKLPSGTIVVWPDGDRWKKP